MDQGFNKTQWIDALDDLGAELAERSDSQITSLCVIGSVACMFDGDSARTSMDCDVWAPASNYNRALLAEAATAVGLLFDPTQEVVARPYLQIVTPGIVQLGSFDAGGVPIKSTGGLSLAHPPVSNLIASKLLRADAKDISDISGLLSRHPEVTAETIDLVLSGFPGTQRERGRENLVFIEVLRSEPLADRPVQAPYLDPDARTHTR